MGWFSKRQPVYVVEVEVTDGTIYSGTKFGTYAAAKDAADTLARNWQMSSILALGDGTYVKAASVRSIAVMEE